VHILSITYVNVLDSNDLQNARVTLSVEQDELFAQLTPKQRQNLTLVVEPGCLLEVSHDGKHVIIVFPAARVARDWVTTDAIDEGSMSEAAMDALRNAIVQIRQDLDLA